VAFQETFREPPRSSSELNRVGASAFPSGPPTWSMVRSWRREFARPGVGGCLWLPASMIRRSAIASRRAAACCTPLGGLALNLLRRGSVKGMRSGVELERLLEPLE